MSARYIPPRPANWTGRHSDDRAYIHEIISHADLSSASIPEISKGDVYLIGYACDEGVRRNQGRPGAKKGPTAFRKALGKMPWHRKEIRLKDAGDWSPDGTDLEGCQEAFAGSVTRILWAGGFPLGIGGGHDMAFAHYKGIRDALSPGTKLGILNFDAHLDLRLPGEKAHSGSPFYEMAQDCESRGESFLYGCLGVRQDANPPELLRRAKDLNVWILWRDELTKNSPSENLRALEAFVSGVDHLYLSIDLDGFSSAYAPGVSAASPLGYGPSEVFPLLDAVLASGKVVAADLAELNPDFDRDGQTAVLAAGIAHRILHAPDVFPAGRL